MAGSESGNAAATETSLKDSEKKAKSTYEQYVESADNTKKALGQLKDQLGEAKQAAQAANAETAAAEATEQGIVSVTDALALMDEQKIAEQQHSKLSAQYMSEAASAFGKTFSSGAEVLTESVIDMGKGIKDSALSTAGLTSLGAGIAVGFLPEAIQSPAAKMLESYLGLKDKNPVDDGVEEKSVEGYEDGKSAAKSAIEDNYKQSGGYDPGTGPDAKGSKDVPGNDGYKPPANTDATSISDDDLGKLADLDAFMDEITDSLENSDNFLAKVAGLGIDAITKTDAGRKTLGEIYDKVHAGEENEGPGGEDKGNDGPDY